MINKNLFAGLAGVIVIAYGLSVRAQSNLPGTQSSYIPEGSLSATAKGQAWGSVRSRLPATVLSPSAGVPSDQLSRGRAQGPGSGGTVLGNLPPVRSSPYLRGYGDSARNDGPWARRAKPYGLSADGRPPAAAAANTTKPVAVFQYGDYKGHKYDDSVATPPASAGKAH